MAAGQAKPSVALVLQLSPNTDAVYVAIISVGDLGTGESALSEAATQYAAELADARVQEEQAAKAAAEAEDGTNVELETDSPGDKPVAVEEPGTTAADPLPPQFPVVWRREIDERAWGRLHAAQQKMMAWQQGLSRFLIRYADETGEVCEWSSRYWLPPSD